MNKDKRERSIDAEIENWETFIGLAKEAASQPTPVAQRDAHFYLDRAQQTRGKAIDPDIVREIDDAFHKSMPKRIAHVEAVIKKYSKDSSEQARSQIEWYASELARLKAMQRKH